VVWAFLVERALERGGDLAIFATEEGAEAAALEYAIQNWPDGLPPSDLNGDVVSSFNAVSQEEYLIVGSWAVLSRGQTLPS
jgi:hypothetical protein